MNKKYRGIVVVALGDSLTDDVHAGIITLQLTAPQNYWTDLVELQTGMRVVNKGVCGGTTSGMLDRVQSDVIDLAPKYCIIMGGYNDLGEYKEESVTNAVKNLGSICNVCLANNIVPILMTEVAGPFNQTTADQQAKAKVLIEELRQKTLEYARLNTVMCIDLCSTALYTDDSYRPFDNVHLQSAGQAVVAQEVITFFDSLIPDIEPEPVTPENYGKNTLSLSYQWSGAEESKRYVKQSGELTSKTVENGVLTTKAANTMAASIAWQGKSAVLYDSVSNEITAALTAKAANTTTAGITWRGTGGGAATVASWALDGISVSDGVLSLIGDDSQAEIDAINGEVV